jgi:hypothetical protein
MRNSFLEFTLSHIFRILKREKLHRTVFIHRDLRRRKPETLNNPVQYRECQMENSSVR